MAGSGIMSLVVYLSTADVSLTNQFSSPNFNYWLLNITTSSGTTSRVAYLYKADIKHRSKKKCRSLA